MIVLPSLFEEILSTKPSLAVCVRKSLDAFEPWLEQSGMPLFPGFTDHSPRHIQDVLRTAASVTSDASHDLLSAADVTVLCIAILLHDCGMHLTQDGFRSIVATTNPPLIPGLGDRQWQQLWRDFIAEAQRFGEEKLVAIFGDAEPIRVDLFDLENLSERDCLLVGEFVRRHHARLAHEIAIHGVPRTTSGVLELVGVEDDVRDIAGLVARSHGTSIRNTFEYLESRYGLVPEYRQIKAPYLMAVLRIADYIQVQSERAIRTLLSVKELRSPISRQEWRAHFAVRDVSTRHEDPEALYVHATPTDVRTYLKLTSLFKDIQRELDDSWATLGEVYGRQGELAKLGLTIRRIRSNLDSVDRFARTVPYIPMKAAFGTSGPELLKLLVGPLYGYEYSVGIREMVQNAVDACRERMDLQSQRVDVGETAESDVVVEFNEAEDGRGWITITDRGVGMTLDTVTRYFLVAGASFRNSDVWKRQHTEESGEVRPLRGGRFGVGVLAAFLLGEEILVRTRHLSCGETDALEFRARIDDPMIELRRCAAPVGTSIRIWVSDRDVLNRFRPHGSRQDDGGIVLEDWSSVDWFRQATPSVVYKWDGFRERANDENTKRTRISAEFRPNSKTLVPGEADHRADWQSLDDPAPYRAIFWRYAKPEKRRSARTEYEIQPGETIAVNGILVERRTQDWSYRGDELTLSDSDVEGAPSFSIHRPSLAILDPAGVCPLNLQRNAVSFERMGIDRRLASSILAQYLEHLRSLDTSGRTLADFKKICGDAIRFAGIEYDGQLAPICATRSGYLLAAPCLLAQQKIQTMIFLASVESAGAVSLENLRDGEALFLKWNYSGVQAELAWFRAAHGPRGGQDWYATRVGVPAVSYRASVSLVPDDKWNVITKKGSVSRDLLRAIKHTRSSCGKVVAGSGDMALVDLLTARAGEIAEIFGQDSEISVWHLNEDSRSADESPLLLRLWLDAFGGPFMTQEN